MALLFLIQVGIGLTAATIAFLHGLGGRLQMGAPHLLGPQAPRPVAVVNEIGLQFLPAQPAFQLMRAAAGADWAPPGDPDPPKPSA